MRGRAGQQSFDFVVEGKKRGAAPRGRGVRERSATRRSKAGRKPAEHRKGFERHGVRPQLDKRHPVHVVLRAKSGLPGFRKERVFKAIRRRIQRAERNGFRVIHFSVQENHIHLLVEAMDRKQLWRGVQHLASRIAFVVNKVLGRHGSLWRDRYTRRDLTSLRQVRNALVYVLMNIRKHAVGEKAQALASIRLDPFSSAAWLEGWDPRAGPMLYELHDDLLRRELFECPVSRPRTWFAAMGWKRHGLLLHTESPRPKIV